MSEEILIVDDNADIRNIINELIIDAGYKTRLAANYNQALAEIDKKLLEILVCPVSKKSLVLNEETNELICEESGLAYPIRDGIPVMLPEEARKI